jgi:hypothetical protein
MITAAHAILYSNDAAADREVLAEILRGGRSVDAGGGWLILGLPPAEVAVHPDVVAAYLGDSMAAPTEETAEAAVEEATR